jgi:3'-5' exoribonuclease
MDANAMKKQFVSGLKAGDGIDDVFVLAEKNVAHKKDGKPYLNLAFSDKSGLLKGVVWDQVEAIGAVANSGDLVQVKGAVSEYRGELQLVVKAMAPFSTASADPSDFLPATARNIEAMWERLTGMTRNMKTPHLRALFDAFWKDEALVQRLKASPAAKKMHHAYVGGLLEHTVSMALLCERIAGHYSGIDMDLLLAGIILHDIGKTVELTTGFGFDYSDSGRLLSHIVLGLQMVDEKLKQVPDFPEDQAVLLKHMIVSHHGSRQFGSPEPPKTLEAVLLHYIDEIDSKVNSIREFIAKEDSGENWTPYHRLLERHFYRGNKKSA